MAQQGGTQGRQEGAAMSKAVGGLKHCPRCGAMKPASAEFFHRNRCAADGFNHYCKPCHRDDVNEREARHPERKREREHARQATKRLDSVSVMQEWATDGCSVCGFSDMRAIQAHHIDPTEKEHDIGRLRGHYLSLSQLREELAKCVPLCSNHHDILHTMWRNGHAGKDSAEIVAIMREEWDR